MTSTDKKELRRILEENMNEMQTISEQAIKKLGDRPEMDADLRKMIAGIGAVAAAIQITTDIVRVLVSEHETTK